MAQLGIQRISATQALFDLGAASVTDTLVCLALGLVPVTVLELLKLLRRCTCVLRLRATWR